MNRKIIESLKSQKHIIYGGYFITVSMVSFKYEKSKNEVNLQVVFAQKLIGYNFFPFISAN